MDTKNPDLLGVDVGMGAALEQHLECVCNAGEVFMHACARTEPCEGWKVLDCCAAPGNKATHLAALVGAQGSVTAFEKDQRRFDTLKRTLARCKASNVQPILGVRISQ